MVYGIDEPHIIQYNALDEYMIINNAPAPWDAESAELDLNKRTILFRTYETQASYPNRNTDINSLIDVLVEQFPDCNVVVVGRYPDQIRLMRNRRDDGAITLAGAVDSGAVLSKCDLFVGSG